jgi:hypothetical protein
MSEALWALIGTALGAIIGAVATIIPVLIQRNDQWRLVTFEKRLEAHQKAYSLCQRVVSYGDNKDAVTLKTKELYRWWQDNCFYLDKNSRKQVSDFTDACMMYVVEKEPSSRNILYYYGKACRALENGIGHKHLESVKDSDTLSDKVLRGLRS